MSLRDEIAAINRHTAAIRQINEELQREAAQVEAFEETQLQRLIAEQDAERIAEGA